MIKGIKLKMSEKVSPQVGISTRNQPKYAPGEKILCFHGALIYEAKVNTRKYYNNCNRQRKTIYYTNELIKCLQVEKTRTNEYSYLVHYNGWSKK